MGVVGVGVLEILSLHLVAGFFLLAAHADLHETLCNVAVWLTTLADLEEASLGMTLSDRLKSLLVNHVTYMTGSLLAISLALFEAHGVTVPASKTRWSIVDCTSVAGVASVASAVG